MKKLDLDDIKLGYVVCGCDKYAFIFTANITAKLPKGYDGELCQECNMWVCSVEVLKNAMEKPAV